MMEREKVCDDEKDIEKDKEMLGAYWLRVKDERKWRKRCEMMNILH